MLSFLRITTSFGSMCRKTYWCTFSAEFKLLEEDALIHSGDIDIWIMVVNLHNAATVNTNVQCLQVPEDIIQRQANQIC